ncbi:MAG: molybdopterin-dependent oxidoreductase [Actinomycetota bacterium]
MPGRRTNLALLVLLAAGFVTGGLAYGTGTSWGRWVVAAHGIVGFAIVALSPWKRPIVRRGLKRERAGRVPSVVFTFVVIATVTFGVTHASGVLRSLGPVTAMQLHVGAALVAVPLAVWHVVARRVRVYRSDLSRRRLLRAGAVLGGAGIAYAATEGLVHLASLPGADRRFTGSFERGSFDPEGMPVTQWLDDSVRDIDPAAWFLRLRVGDVTRNLSYDQIAEFEDRVTAVLDCTGGWFAEQEWEGILVSRLVGDTAHGRSIAVGSATGYGRRFPVDAAGDLLLATRVGGAPLSAGHGRPARLVASGRRGFWWVKWVTSIEVSDVPWWWQSPFPLT